MMFNNTLLPGVLSGLVFSSLALAAPAPSPVAQLGPPTTTITPGGPPCTHNETNRACWKDGFNITTDYELSTPPGKTKTYDFFVTNETSFSADGITKWAMLINGKFPGPTVFADWGDYLVINVHNQMKDNGTSIHWHGIRQLNTNLQDGANGVTECPVAPGKTRTYTFRATQYGTSWYHSHFSSQYGNGVVGTIHINGPASANYDIDLGTYPITDLYYETADVIQRRAEINPNPPPPSDNVVFNGTNVNPNGPGGSYNRVTLTPGKKHRLRLINTSVENHFTVSLSGHNFTVIATDFVPVNATVRNTLFMAIGQRYDVIIEAAQAPAHYWFNATLSSGFCGVSNNTHPAAIFSYANAPATPNNQPTDPGAAVPANNCVDESGFVPIVSRTAPRDQFLANEKPLDVTLDTPTINGTSLFRWKVNASSINVDWGNPTLKYVANKNTSYPTELNVVVVDQANMWTFWVIQNNFFLPHPFHLHGHDFLQLGIGSGTFSPSTGVDSLNFNNPIRRDVAMLPGNGWLVIAFPSDNPGAWLMHCHIAWHVSQGLSVQFLEQRDRIAQTMDLGQLDPTCKDWNAYYPTSYYHPKTDSGL